MVFCSIFFAALQLTFWDFNLLDEFLSTFALMSGSNMLSGRKVTLSEMNFSKLNIFQIENWKLKIVFFILWISISW